MADLAIDGPLVSRKGPLHGFTGFARDWQPAEFGPDHHLGYALQWAGLGTTAVVLWIVLSIRRKPAR